MTNFWAMVFIGEEEKEESGAEVLKRIMKSQSPKVIEIDEPK